MLSRMIIRLATQSTFRLISKIISYEKKNDGNERNGPDNNINTKWSFP